MHVPHVSILIPAYHERYFAEALASARTQEPPSIEILVADDSGGGAIRACVEAAADPRIRYMRNDPVRGFEGNFTFLLSEACGDFVKFLNDDDRLRPGCVARLAAALDADPRATLATSRRTVIDELGAPRADTPATAAISHATCTIEGLELGDLALVNSTNFIGEPTTAMFRRGDVVSEAGGLFTWHGKSYRCLADLSLWLRLLAKGRAFYCATPLSEYRVHAGQEQRAAHMGAGCITERLDLVRAARAEGFIAQPAQYRAALHRVDVLCTAWQARPGVPAEQRDTLRRLSTEIEGLELATH